MEEVNASLALLRHVAELDDGEGETAQAEERRMDDA